MYARTAHGLADTFPLGDSPEQLPFSYSIVYHHAILPKSRTGRPMFGFLKWV